MAKNFQMPCLPVLFLLAIVLGMAGWASYHTLRWALAYRWPTVPCDVLFSDVVEGGGRHPYAFGVGYRYSWGGRQYIGGKYRGERWGSWDIAEAGRLVRAFPQGSRRTCFVNPHRPSEAVLAHDNPLLPAALAVAMLVIGAVLVNIGSYRGPGIVPWSSLFVLLIGGAGYGGFFGLPLWTGVRALGWRPTPCVVRSTLVRSDYKSGWPVSYTTYWPDIVYEYRVGGVNYRANTYNASDVGSIWYYGARKTTRQFPPGSAETCYVNPSDPSEAVLTRHVSGTQLFGLWPLMLAVLGVGCLLAEARGRPIRVGTPRLWAWLVLWVATTCALYVVVVTGSDLIADWVDGLATAGECAVVAVAGLVSVALLIGWVALAMKGRRCRPRAVASRTGTKGVWDCDLDRTV